MTLSNGRVNEVEQVGIAIDSEPITPVTEDPTGARLKVCTYRFAAFAVSMTLPPPTARK